MVLVQMPHHIRAAFVEGTPARQFIDRDIAQRTLLSYIHTYSTADHLHLLSTKSHSEYLSDALQLHVIQQ